MRATVQRDKRQVENNVCRSEQCEWMRWMVSETSELQEMRRVRSVGRRRVREAGWISSTEQCMS